MYEYELLKCVCGSLVEVTFPSHTSPSYVLQGTLSLNKFYRFCVLDSRPTSLGFKYRSTMRGRYGLCNRFDVCMRVCESVFLNVLMEKYV